MKEEMTGALGDAGSKDLKDSLKRQGNNLVWSYFLRTLMQLTCNAAQIDGYPSVENVPPIMPHFHLKVHWERFI